MQTDGGAQATALKYMMGAHATFECASLIYSNAYKHKHTIQDIRNMQAAEHMPLFCIDVLTRYIKSAHRF